MLVSGCVTLRLDGRPARMLEHLKQRVIETLRPVSRVILATSGPAGLQASSLPCEVAGLRLYMLVPRSSDHLFNLESNPGVVATNDNWEVRGQARAVEPADWPAELTLTLSPEAAWYDVLELSITQMQIRLPDGWSNVETIDVDDAL
jgi:hypothetical protein